MTGPDPRLRFLWRYARPWKYRILLSLLGLTFVSLASLLYPWLLKLMVDQFSGRTSPAISLDALCALLLVVFLLSTVAGYYQQVEMRTLGYRLRNSMRMALYAALLSSPMSFHRQTRVGEITSRATEDIGRMQILFSSLLSPAFQNTLFLSGCLAMMAWLNATATLMVVGLVVLPIPFVWVASRKIRTLTARGQAHHAHANAFLEESLVAMREIKAFAREKLEFRRYADSLDRALGTEIAASNLHVKINQVIYMLFSGALLAIFYTGTRRTFFPHWTLGDIIAFYFYSYTMTTAVLSVGRVYLTYQEISGSLGRVMDLLEEPGESPSEGLVSRPMAGKVAFRNVAFAYETERPVLTNVTLTVNPGEWQLITGASGSGKSTLAGMLMGFCRPGHGTVTVDDIPLPFWQPGSLRRQIGYVGQDPLLIHGTLRENILFLDVPATEQQLARAIDLSCLGDLVSSLPGGLDTIVGERGYTLSAGQKTRVAIARAILHDPPVLILDEANAALEEDLERQLWMNLAAARAERTTIIFSHHSEHIPAIYNMARLDNGVLHFLPALHER